MSSCEQRADEDDSAYLRRRAQTRANYLMIEQRHDEDEKSFRDRLDSATETLRQRRHQAMDWVQSLGRSARTGAGDLATRADTLYRDNPLIRGCPCGCGGRHRRCRAAATRIEEEQLGAMGAKALDAAKDKVGELGDVAREKKDALVSDVRGNLEQ